MRRLICTFTLVIAALMLAACTTPGPVVTADYDRNADFNAYRTFAFFEPLGTDAAGYESLVTQTLKSAVRREMETRGYTYAEAGPDLLINFNAKLAQQTRVSQTPARRCTTATAAASMAAGAATATTPTSTSTSRARSTSTWSTPSASSWSGRAWPWAASPRSRRKTGRPTINAAVAEIFAKFPFRAG